MTIPSGSGSAQYDMVEFGVNHLFKPTEPDERRCSRPGGDGQYDQVGNKNGHDLGYWQHIKLSIMLDWRYVDTVSETGPGS